MATNLLLAFLSAALCVALTAACIAFRHQPLRSWQWHWLVASAVVAGLGSLVLYLPAASGTHFDTWNWQGKALQTVLAVTLIQWLGWRGVIGAARPGAWLSWPALLLFSLIVLLGLLRSVVFPGGEDEPHRLIYQMTMPGLAEETFFRGAMLTLVSLSLSRATTDRPPLAAYVIVSGLYCVAHGVYPVDGSLAVDAMAMVSPLIVGTLLCGLRHTSGSVVPCIAAHNIFNAL